MARNSSMVNVESVVDSDIQTESPHTSIMMGMETK